MGGNTQTRNRNRKNKKKQAEETGASSQTEQPLDDDRPSNVMLAEQVGAKEPEEGLAEAKVTDAKKAEGVIWEGDDPYTCVGYNPFSSSSGVDSSSSIESLIDFPKFFNDPILKYDGDFSLASWYKNHLPVGKRWLASYRSWKGAKLRREVLAIVQALLNCILDHITHHSVDVSYRPHGSLNDFRNYKLYQTVVNHAGCKKVKFIAELINPSKQAVGFQEDLDQFGMVLNKLFEGGSPDSELQALPYFLSRALKYPRGWQSLVLRDFPGLWDADERVAFYINVSNHYVNDWNMDRELATCMKATQKHVSREFPGHWQYKIQAGTVYDYILRHPRHIDYSVKYYDADWIDILRYIRNTFHHFRQDSGGYGMDIKQIEWELSEVYFPKLPLNIYSGMCMCNTFLNS